MDEYDLPHCMGKRTGNEARVAGLFAGTVKRQIPQLEEVHWLVRTVRLLSLAADEYLHFH
jgi:hypothetical protein